MKGGLGETRGCLSLEGGRLRALPKGWPAHISSKHLTGSAWVSGWVLLDYLFRAAGQPFDKFTQKHTQRHGNTVPS